jgi:CDP-diacylglycerol--glycerol-3-phosphate 3-phosphatidyltransferase
MRLTIPNQLTILRILISPLLVYLFLLDKPYTQLWASILFFIGSLTDWYDGWYARRFGVITRWGQFMDPLADKILVTSALIVFALLNYVFWWMVWIIIIRDFIITLNRIYSLTIGKAIITHTVAKWKTASQMFAIFLILIYINWRNFYSGEISSYQAQYFDAIGITMMIVTFLTIISGIIYITENREMLLGLFRKILHI